MSDALEPDQRAADTSAKRELFNEAVELLDEKGVFMLAVRALRIRWYNEWLEAKDYETEVELRSRSKVLRALPEELQRFINDYKFALHKQGQRSGVNPKGQWQNG